MKQPRKPTRNEKEIIKSHGLNPDEWGVAFYDSEFYMKLVNKETGQTKIIDRFKRKR